MIGKLKRDLKDSLNYIGQEQHKTGQQYDKAFTQDKGKHKDRGKLLAHIADSYLNQLEFLGEKNV